MQVPRGGWGCTVIVVSVNYVDGGGRNRRFKSLAGARRFAQRAVGTHPELGATYAVAGDGCATVRVDGVRLSDLFPELTHEGDDQTQALEYGLGYVQGVRGAS